MATPSCDSLQEIHQGLNFIPPAPARARGGGIWSIAWSADAADVVAGTSMPGLVVYDMARETPKAVAPCHRDDVNGICFVDAECNLVATGSDDTNLFLHDKCAPASLPSDILVLFAIVGCLARAVCSVI